MSSDIEIPVPAPHASPEAERLDAFQGVTPIVYDPLTRRVHWYCITDGSGNVAISVEQAEAAAALFKRAAAEGRKHKATMPDAYTPEPPPPIPVRKAKPKPKADPAPAPLFEGA